MNSYEQAFERVLRKQIEAEIAARSGVLIDGSFATLEDYRERVGFVRALKYALELCDETKKKLENE